MLVTFVFVLASVIIGDDVASAPLLPILANISSFNISLANFFTNISEAGLAIGMIAPPAAPPITASGPPSGILPVQEVDSPTIVPDLGRYVGLLTIVQFRMFLTIQ